MDSKYSDYAILGGGTAGIRCAIELARQGKSVRVLEADSILGGRAKSITFNRSPYTTSYHIDLHSHWNHGGPDSPFVQWFCRHFQDRIGMFGIKKWDQLFALDKVDRVFDIREGQIMPGFRHRGGQLFEQAFDDFEKRHPGKDTTLAHLAHWPGDDRLPQHAQFTSATWAGVEGAAFVSAREYVCDPAGSGGYQVVGGMARMQSAMVDDAKRHGTDFVLNFNAVSAKQEKDRCVFTDDKGDQYFSRYAGISVPIGVLQHNAIEFNASLPPNRNGNAQFYHEIKRYAHHLTMGRMTKITVPLDIDFFNRAGIAPNERYDFRDGQHMFCHAYSAGNPTATIYAGGDLAMKLEAMGQRSQGEVNDFIAFALDQIPAFEGYRLCLDAEPHVTSCNTSPYSYGAYSALKPGYQRRDPMIYGRFVFFGEAFVADIRNSPATLVGANYSGGRAAEILSSDMEQYEPMPAARLKMPPLQPLSAAAN